MQLISANCLSCHNAEKEKGGIDLTQRENALKGGDNGPILAPGKPDQSLLLQSLAPDADPHMPPKKQLSTNQIDLLRKWISAGAPWDQAILERSQAPREIKFEGLPPNHQPVLSLAISPDEKRLAVGRGNLLQIYDLTSSNYTILKQIKAHSDLVRSIAWKTNCDHFISGSFRELKMWDAKTMEPVWMVSSNLIGQINGLLISSDGKRLIAADSAASENGWVRCFASETGTIIKSWNAHTDSICGLAISPNGEQLATSGADKLVKVWQLESGSELAQLEGHLAAVSSVAFNTNGSELISAGLDKQLKVWDLATRESVVGIGGKKHGFNAVAWARDGKNAIAADDDGGLWKYSDFKRHTGAQSSDTANERRLARFPEPLNAVVISGDSQRVFAGSQDGVVYILDTNGKVLKRLEPIAEAPRIVAGGKTNALTAPSFVRDVLPVMAKAGCMAGACHAKADGQNGFKLSVFSYDPKGDYCEIVKEGRGRRVFPATPGESLLLRKATLSIEHGGGRRFEPDSDAYKTIAEWIRSGMTFQHTNEPSLVHISVNPSERVYKKGSTQKLKVKAHFSDDSTRDVTKLADFVANDKEIAHVNDDGLVQVGKVSGETVIVARYMGMIDAARVTVPADRTLPTARFAKLPVNNFIDEYSYAHFRKLGLFPSERCTDEEFIRRSSLDTIGRLPTIDETKRFLTDTNFNKRAAWIDYLLSHPAYGDYWAGKWADLLRPNPDRVGVKSVYILDQWLRESFRNNVAYDELVRAILLAEGSNHRDGPAVVYRDRREPSELTTMFSQLFLGTRMECAKCHHHPTEKWSQTDFYQFAAFFGPVKQKGAGLSPPISGGTESFYFSPGGVVKHPVTEEAMLPRPPDGAVINIATNTDPRRQLASWLLDSKNPYFSRAAVNRVWAVFFGRGFVNPVDDFRASNPAVNEALLNALAEDFAKNRYDLKHLMRAILSSHVYELSSTPNEFNLTDTKNFSRSYRRRLPAEVLLDAVNDVTGVTDEFNGCPPGTRAVQTWSYKVRSQFLDAFGRPNSSSDCPCERDLRSSVVQSLHMMNSRALQAKLSNGEGRVKRLAESQSTPEEIVRELYLAALNRNPGTEELQTATASYSSPGSSRQTATEDVLWAILNSAEFTFNH